VVEGPRYYSAAAEEKVPFVVACTGFKRRRQGVLVTAKTKQFLAISMPQHAVAGTPSNFLVSVFGRARPPVSFSFTKGASSNVNAPLQHEHGIRV
jgi:hypothetical protein